MSIDKAEELINSAVVYAHCLEDHFNSIPNIIFCRAVVQDLIRSLIDAREELKGYKL